MNFLNYILARAEAEEAGAFEAIMLNSAGNVAEASTANLFFVGAEKLITPCPECDILPGITRATVLELASGMGIERQERKIEPSELATFSECFLTNSGVELVPVTRIDDSPVGDGRPGHVHARLHEAYRELAQEG
jgi:branched-chain amino acid aminotransferase